MKVGLFVTVALILLAAAILQQSWGVRFLTPIVNAMTYLPNVGGLKAGAPVWLAGIEVGRVRRVTIVPPEIYAGNIPIFHQVAELKKRMEAVDPRSPNAKEVIADLFDQLRTLKAEMRFVEVQMEIRSEYLNRISRDSEVSIESRGLIGDSFIEISAGTYGVPPLKSGDYYLIEGARTTGFREIMTGANDVIANFGVLSEQVKNIAFKIDPAKVGSSMVDTMNDLQRTLQQAEQTFGRATALVEDLRSGEGSFGRLVADPTLYRRLLQSLDKFNKIADEIQNGSGTLAKLMKDPSIFDNANETLRKAEIMMDRIEKGEGTLGKMSKDPALFDSSRKALDKFSSFVEQADRGEGTLGKLLKDPGLYNNLNQSSAEITKLLYDLRQDPKRYLTIRLRLF